MQEIVAGDERPPILALLPHYGDPEGTILACRTLHEAAYPRLHLVVVDNSGNLDASTLPEDTELVAPEKNVGYCAAVNIGVERAIERGDPLMLFVNNDTETEAGAIERLVDALLSERDVAGIGPLVTDAKGSSIWSAGAFLRFGPNEVIQRGIGLPIDEAPGYPTEVDFIPGAFALYRTADLEAVGGIDEHYFMYLEDVDLGIRLRRRGRRLLYLPWVRVQHGGSISSGGGTTPLRKFLNGVNTPRLLWRARSPRLWLSFLIFDVVGLIPSILLHIGNRRRMAAQIAKGRGILLGLFGYRPGIVDVVRYTS